MSQDQNVASILQAVSYAARAHQGQLRKDQQTPYAAHPMRVMTIMALVFHVDDPELLATALLHDTIEDTPTDFDDLAERFGSHVAHHVALLTKDMRLPEQKREEHYFQTLARSPVGVQLCKLADTFDNLVDSTSLPVATRIKTVQKAAHLIEIVRDQMVGPWPQAVQAVEQQIERVKATL